MLHAVMLGYRGQITVEQEVGGSSPPNCTTPKFDVLPSQCTSIKVLISCAFATNGAEDGGAKSQKIWRVFRAWGLLPVGKKLSGLVRPQKTFYALGHGPRAEHARRLAGSRSHVRDRVGVVRHVGAPQPKDGSLYDGSHDLAFEA